MIDVLDIFSKVIDALKTHCTNLASGMRFKEQPRWGLADSELEKPANYDIDAGDKIFDREEIATASTEVETKRDKALLIAQNDIMSGMARDYLLQKRSRIRRLAHEAVKRAKAGSEYGILNAGIMEYMLTQTKRYNNE